MKKLKDQFPRIKENANDYAQTFTVREEDSSMLREDMPLTKGSVKSYDLEERTAIFGEAVIRFSKKIPRDPTNNRLIDQVVGAGTSVGANFIEATEAVSKKDFRFSISRCKKESKETRFFMRMIAMSEPSLKDEARSLYREAHELLLIFAEIYRK